MIEVDLDAFAAAAAAAAAAAFAAGGGGGLVDVRDTRSVFVIGVVLVVVMVALSWTQAGRWCEK